MKRSPYFFFFAVLVLLSTVVFSKCGDSATSTTKTLVDSTSPMGPAPDNNASNNPSLADTNYERDRRPDTGKKK